MKKYNTQCFFNVALVILGLVLAGGVLAHQPRIVKGGGVVEIENPEVSQAFYGELKGETAYYRIADTEPFNLYVGILVPDLPGIGKDVSAKVSSGGRELFLLDGLNSEWTYFYEEFAGDGYWQGPEVQTEAGPAGFDIEVLSGDNQGKYVLVVGEKEEFPLGEALRTLVTLPSLKKDFFEKSVLTVFSGKIGRALLVFLVVIVAGVIALVVWVFRKKQKKSKN